MILDYLFILLTGIAVGFISTLFGLGGGIIMVPILSLIFPISHLEAVATSLATIVLVAAFNTYNFHRKNVINWTIVPWIAGFSATVAFLSAQLSLYLPEKLLIAIFLLFLLWVTLRTFFIRKETVLEPRNQFPRWLAPGIGSLSGLISGLTGIGGGGITTPLMLITRLVTHLQAAPTSNAIMIFTALFAAASFALSDFPGHRFPIVGFVHLDTSLLLFAGSALISRLGVRLNHVFPLFWRKTLLGIILLFICFRLIVMLVNS